MRNKILVYGMICILTGIFAFASYERLKVPLVGIDDANIYYVFARNFVEGHGFVYNVGGERVEGFTSILYTLICAAAYVAGHIELTLCIVNVMLLAFALTLAVYFIRSVFSTSDHKHAGWIWSGVFLLLVYLMPAYIAWNTVSLMDVGLMSSILLVAVILVLRADEISERFTNIVMSVFVFLLLVTRPESMLWGLVLLFGLFMLHSARVGAGGAMKSVVAPVLTYALTLIGLTLFRVQYFGYPLPNTYYAKVSPSMSLNLRDGGRYLSEYVGWNVIVLAAVVSVLLTLIHDIRRWWQADLKFDRFMMLPLLGMVGLLLPVLTGGDHYHSFRFYQPVYPILLLNLLYFVRFVLPQYIELSWRQRSSRLYRTVMIALIAVALILTQVRHWRHLQKESYRLYGDIKIAIFGRELGRLLTETFSELPRYPSIGVTAAGGQKYTYAGEVIDLLGLTNVAMAHNGGLRKNIKNHAAFERYTFYELVPDIVYPYMKNGKTWAYDPREITGSFGNIAFKGLFHDERFQNEYIFTKIAREDSNDNRIILGFVRKGYVPTLVANNNLDVETYDYNVRQ